MPEKEKPESREERIESDARARVARSHGALTIEDARVAAAAQADADDAAAKAAKK